MSGPTSKPLHVRLEVMVDEKQPELCGTVCPRLNVDRRNGLATCIEFGALKWGAQWESPPPLRHGKCVEATTADALNAAVVEAAKQWADDGPTDWNFTTDRELFTAVDALRYAETKEKR